MNPLDKCWHGKRFNEPCLECELIWEQDTVKNFEPIVRKAKARIKAIRAALPPASTEAE